MAYGFDTTWDQVKELVARDDEGKHDHFFSPLELRMKGGRLALPKPVDDGQGRKFLSVELDQRASGQMCGRIEVPVSYYRKISERSPDLADAVLNEGLAHLTVSREQVRNLLLRMKGGIVRAVLSQEYRRIDNRQIVDSIERATVNLGNSRRIRSFSVTPENMWLKLTMDNIWVDDPLEKGSPVHLGVIVGNSEVGSRAIDVYPFIFRKACTNDLVVLHSRAVSHRHIGSDDRALLSTVEKAIAVALVDGRPFLDRFVKAVATPVAKPEEHLRAFCQDRGLSQAFTEQAILAHRHETGDTLFAIINALTRAAQTEKPDSRVEIEMYAGSLLNEGSAPWAVGA